MMLMATRKGKSKSLFEGEYIYKLDA